MAKNQLLEAGHQEDTELGEDTLADMKDIKVTVSSSKVNAVLMEIMRIARDKPEDKIVVVSQFTSFLNILQPLLDENQFTYTRLDGSMSFGLRNEALKSFRKTGQYSPKVQQSAFATSTPIDIPHSLSSGATAELDGRWGGLELDSCQPPATARPRLESCH